MGEERGKEGGEGVSENLCAVPYVYRVSAEYGIIPEGVVGS